MPLRLLSRRHNLMFTFDGAPPPRLPAPKGMRVVRVTDAILEEMMAAPEHTSRKQRYQRFLANGLVGFMVVTDQEWAAAAWIAPPTVSGFPGQIPERLARKHWWFFEAHTNPPYRGRGLHKVLATERLNYLAEQSGGTACAVSDVNPANVPSRRSMEAVGFKRAGTIDIWHLRIPHLPRRPFSLWRHCKKHPQLENREAS